MDSAPDRAPTPAALAAKRAGSGAQQRRRNARAYPRVVTSDDATSLSIELAATRALAEVGTEDEIGVVVRTLVHDLGGGLVPSRLADPATTVPIEVSLGLTEPMLPYAEPVSVAALRLTAVLPGFLEVARLALSRLRHDVQREDEATRDLLTGVLTRRAFMRRLSGAAPGDSVCMIDLDHFKAVNDVSGHEAGDAVLRVLGGLLVRSFRDGDSCGRYGGDELVCLAPGLPAGSLADRCDAVREAWERERPVVGAAVGLSVGVAQVDRRGGRAALSAADSAMYVAKASGRDRTVVAAAGDVEVRGSA